MSTATDIPEQKPDGVDELHVLEAVGYLQVLSGCFGPDIGDGKWQKAENALDKLNLNEKELADTYDRTRHAIKSGVYQSTIGPSNLMAIGLIADLNEFMRHKYPDFDSLKNPTLYVHDDIDEPDNEDNS